MTAVAAAARTARDRIGLRRRGFRLHRGAGLEVARAVGGGAWPPPAAAVDALVDRVAPGRPVVSVRRVVALPWAPSSPVATRSPDDVDPSRLRLLVAPADVIGHDAQLRVGSGDHPEATIPLSAGDTVSLAAGCGTGCHANHTPQERLLVEVVVARHGTDLDDHPAPPTTDHAGPAGFRVVDLLDRAELAAIRRLLDALPPAGARGFFASARDVPGSVARGFDLAAREVVATSVAGVVPGYRPFMIAVTAKGADSPHIEFHHDWTYTDERESRAVFLWCPLVDTEPANGGLRAVPGSHRWIDLIRASRPDERPVETEPFQAELAALAEDLTVPAGAAVVFDPGVLHGSHPNPTADARPAITIALAPTDRSLVHVHRDEAGELHGFEVDDAFFTVAPYRSLPSGYPPLHPWTRALGEDDLASALRSLGGRTSR